MGLTFSNRWIYRADPKDPPEHPRDVVKWPRDLLEAPVGPARSSRQTWCEHPIDLLKNLWSSEVADST
jgi:hypothetical protein